MKATFKIEGLKELDKALGDLPKRVAKATLRRVLKEAAEPMARQARRNAPVSGLGAYTGSTPQAAARPVLLHG